MANLYENIRKRRETLGMSQNELATKTGYSDRTSISKIESGNVDLTQSRIMAFAKALNTTVSELMGWDEEESRSDNDPPEHKNVVRIAYDKNVFAANLGRLMQQNGEKQTDIAKLLKVSKSTVSEYCKGKLMPRMDKIKILSDYYGTTISDLLEPQQSLDHCLNSAPLVPCKNTVRITSRDGSSIEKALSDEQAAALKVIIEQLPEFHSTYEMS